MKVLEALICIGIISLLPLSVAAQQSAPQPLVNAIQRDFAASEFWDDGLAEVAHYQAERVIYGAARPYEAHLITVKEDFNTEYYAKADWPYGQKPILPVLKQNYVGQISTPNYDYHYNRSLFVDRENFSRSVKLTITGFEWCGNAYKEFQLWHDSPLQIYHSYWDGEGSGQRKLSNNDNMFLEEELFLLLRGLKFEDGLEAYFQLYTNQTTNRAPEPVANRAGLHVVEGEESWQVSVQTEEGRSMMFEFDVEYPHVLLQFEHSDGRKMSLESVSRYAYWEIQD